MIHFLLLACTASPPTDTAQDVVDTGEAPLPWTLAACEDGQEATVALPADDAVHMEEPEEWWYWTGHLATADGRQFGFEYAVFMAEYSGFRGMMVHTALTDIAAQDFSVETHMGLGSYTQEAASFDFAFGEQSARGGDGQDQLHAEWTRGEPGAEEAVTIDLEITELRHPVLNHCNGYHDYDFGGHTWYYSRTRMDAVGTIQLGDETLEVTGDAWFDHQWGELFGAADTGWDWFALQLEDGREIMLFGTRPGGEPRLEGGTLVHPDGRFEELDPDTVSVSARRTWTNAAGDCTYPLEWDLTVGDEQFLVTPVMDDQAVDFEHMPYWEGASTVTGSVAGRAYVELTGYCNGPG
jgi:predicted secreted hydrolase